MASFYSHSPLSISDFESQSSTEHNISMGRDFAVHGDYCAEESVKDYLRFPPSPVKMVSTDAVCAPLLEQC